MFDVLRRGRWMANIMIEKRQPRGARIVICGCCFVSEDY